MKADELDYDLPSELIAQEPAAVRSESRLLVLDRSTGALTDSRFDRLRAFLDRGDCLVLNDTKVLPARFFARRGTGGKLEGLYLGPAATPHVWQTMLKGARRVRPGERIVLQDRQQHDACAAEVVEKHPDGVCLLRIETDESVEAVLDAVGYPPLPPYIRRDRDPDTARHDRQRYQTVYARHAGAVAAPTAGLHFTDELIRDLKAAGIRMAYVTLHVGAGTFKPIAVEHVEQHRIHREAFHISKENAAVINATREAGGRIVAVGTTAVRVLETVSDGSRVGPADGATDLFITPGYRFKSVDAIVTNFHLPRSTLLALVAAFAGLENIWRAYRHAVEQRYRFYSYGDAMLILDQRRG